MENMKAQVYTVIGEIFESKNSCKINFRTNGELIILIMIVITSCGKIVSLIFKAV